MFDFSVAGLLERIAEQPAFRALVADLAVVLPGEGVGPLALPEAARPAVVAALARALRAPLIWVMPQPEDARVVAEALRAYLPRPERVHVLPAPDALPFERIPWDPATRELRMAALAALYRWSIGPEGGAPIVVASLRGLLTCLLSPETFAADAILLQPAERLGLGDLLTRLDRLGYERVASVSEPGQMARRGGIVDLFPPSERQPIRIEWFGDEIDSLRRFDPSSQRSTEALDSLVVVPAAEALPQRGPEVAEALGRLDLGRLHPLAESELRRQMEHLAAGERFAGIEFFGPHLHPERATALSYFPDGSWIVVDSLDRLAVASHGLHGQAATARSEQVEAGELPADWDASPLARWAEVEAELARFRQLDVGQLGATRDGAPSATLAGAFASPPRFGGRIEDAVVDAVALAEAGSAVVVVTRQAPRFAELLADAGLSLAPTTHLETAPAPGGLAVVHGALGSGWTLTGGSGDTVVLTDGELFGWRMPHRRGRGHAEARRAPDYFSELTPGNYVVHIEHGIGVFRGLSRMQVGETEREYLQIEYAQSDMLYVPTHQADRVSRYVGAGEAEPPVNRLGTADWERAKERARRAVEDIAKELLELYARREVARRSAFSPDTAWQAEMEAAFPYTETDDQLKAIEDVKRDMESERPMDRLVVGDVGFGKTEVAVRAAFKAVMGGRQVAVLAPTTVLAQQHYETFRQRMAPFPVRVEMLSRFRSRAEQAEILDRLGTREVDIVVGTHRLLSPDVRFKDLGLLVIDEEHRFGVKAKERLRALREGVDTLTLTATPIPRTMHMALTGLRDLTTIDTPPEERRPVVTQVGPTDDNLIRQAIRRELARGGQVFYVYNRVMGIQLVGQKVLRLVPEARVSIAHGQMHEDELAQAMLDFVAGATDVLVCTSIIESGLDIQNANTLIVERADRFGLAQMHQLRGRVGRSAQRAYAYFLYPPHVEMPPEAKERLEALAEASDLGSGFRLAMRDLEIRGAGEILGARQHGQVAAIGLDLYTRLLAEAIKKLRADGPGEPDRIAVELESIDPGTLPTVDLPLDAFLPDSYVEETAERTRLYRRMATADAMTAVDEIERELVDRFGRPPESVANLVTVLRLRVLAHLAGAQSIGREGPVVAIRWQDKHALNRPSLKARLDPKAMIGRHQVSLPVTGPPSAWLPLLRATLEAAAEVEGAAARTEV